MPSAALFDADSYVLPALFQWCGVAHPDPAFIRELLATPTNAQDDGNFPEPEGWTEQQRAAFLGIVSPTMRELGYAAPF